MNKTEGQGDVGGAVFNYPDNTDFGLNARPFSIGSTTIEEGWNRGFWVDTLGEYFGNECKHCKIKIEGFASTQGNQAATSSTNSSNNQKLSKKRADAVKKYLEDALVFGGYQAEVGDKFKNAKISGAGSIDVGDGCSGENGQDRLGCKEARKVTITIDYDANQAKKDKPSVPAPDPVEPPPPTTAIPKCRFFTEANYFEKLRETDKFAYSSLKEKIKFFHPSFHSITPEGFNSRLNFLLQCTRQGPTLNEDGNPGNLAFGRAPVCILRIGDFYYTKIIIDSMNIDYEPLVWDLNPEGVGVQPMIANISINFSFIGGSSLNGPINKLQNAISFNFFANAEVYDPRADRVVKSDNPKPNSKATAEIQPGKFPDDRLPVEDSDKKEGLSNNTNEPTESQEDVAATENSTEEAVQEPEMSEDAKILNNIRLNAYTNNDDNHHVVIISDELELLGEGWSYNVGTFTNGQFIKLDTQPINVDEDLSGNNLNRLDIDSTLSRGDGIRIAWDYDSSFSIAEAAQRYNSAEVF
jgi:flagellar motor protein MotB